MTTNANVLDAHKKARWYNVLLLRCLDQTTDVDEAIRAANLAMEVQPEPPVDASFSDSEKWITIGGHAEGDEKHVGGFKVVSIRRPVKGSGTVAVGRVDGRAGRFRQQRAQRGLVAGFRGVHERGRGAAGR